MTTDLKRFPVQRTTVEMDQLESLRIEPLKREQFKVCENEVKRAG